MIRERARPSALASLRRRGLSLIELLVATGIVATLAAIALPNLLDAQTRGKVAAAKAAARSVANALEAYAVDHRHYPPTRPIFPDDPLALLADSQLEALTTPIAYASLAALRDPFRLGDQAAEYRSAPGRLLPEDTPPNPDQSLLYFEYGSLMARTGWECLERKGAGVVSLGPDGRDSFGAYRPFEQDCFDWLFSYGYPGGASDPALLGLSLPRSPIDTVYDPTNGLASEGDIARFAGDAARFATP